MSDGWTTALALVAFVLGVASGSAMLAASFEKDCQMLGKARSADAVYECRRVK